MGQRTGRPGLAAASERHTEIALHTHPPQLVEDLDEILARTEPLWEEFRGQRIFVTGGTGFFGKWLLEALLWANRRLALNASATVLTRDRQRFLRQMPHFATESAICFANGDVRTFTPPAGEFSHIVHMATTSAEATFANEPPLEKFTTAAFGTQRVLEFAARCGARKFLLTSSGNAYGPISDGASAILENHIGAPDITQPIASALGEGKRAAELLARIYADSYGYEVKICRCFTFIGPYLQTDIHYAAGNFIRDAIEMRPIRVRGNGRPLRSFMYPTDLMVWLLTLLCRAPSGRMYNIGSNEVVSIADLATRIAAFSGGTVQIENTALDVATASPSAYVPATGRICQELGVEQRIALDTAIARTIRYYRSDGFQPVR